MNIREKQKQQSSDSILKASMHVFGVRGYHATKYAEISKLANVTNGLIVQRFKSRENLFFILFKEALINNFPSFDDCANIRDCLNKIVVFIKLNNKQSHDYTLFVLKALDVFDDIPEQCVNSLNDLFIKSKFSSFLENEIDEIKIESNQAFNIFVSFIKNCCALTIEVLNKNIDLPENKSYLSLFSLSNQNLASTNQNIKANVKDLLFDESGVATWRAEFDEFKNPKIYLEKEILEKIGLNTTSTPEYNYQYLMKYIVAEDKTIVSQAIDRMLNGETVELTFDWVSPTTDLLRIRCFGKKVNSDKNIKLEGFFQRFETITFLKNTRETAELLIKAISPDYDSVSYIYIGRTKEEDYFIEYKKSDFLIKATNNWEGKTSFTDCLRLTMEKFISSADKEEFKETFQREKLLKELQINKVYSRKFRVQYYGGFYHYQITFIADTDENNKIVGLVCGIRMVNYEDQTKNSFVDIELIKNKVEKTKELNALFVKKLDAAYLVNLHTNTFEVVKRSDNVAKRNRIVPDFRIYVKTFIDKDVYFEDREYFLKEIENIETKLQQNDGIYSFNFRDISTGTPLNNKATIITAGKNLIAVGIQSIEGEQQKYEFIREENEKKIRELQQEIQDKNLIINNVNASLTEIMVDVANARRENSIKHQSRIRETTFTLAKQIMHDYPDYNLTNNLITKFGKAATLHDIGKIAIPDSILYKLEPLTEEEYQILKNHSLNGLKIIKNLKSFWSEEYFQIVYDICKYHHERYDGKGYPEGLKGEQIPLCAQIVSITDVFEALITDRIYKGPYTPNKAFEMIINGECGTFNPKIIQSFKNCFQEIKRIVTEDSSSITFKVNDIYDPYQYQETINENTLPIIAYFSEQMPCGFFIYENTNEGRILFFNDLMVKMFGCSSREDFVKHTNNSFRGIVKNEEYDEIQSLLKVQIEKSEHNFDSVKFRIAAKNGKEKLVKDYSHLVHSETYGDVIYVFLEDVSNEENVQNNKFISVKSSVLDKNNGSHIGLLEGARVLLVDDNELSCYMTKDSLEEEGVMVTVFTNVNDALTNIEITKPYDIILLDLHMPIMNGAELTEKIRYLEEDRDIRVPIVILTGDEKSDLAKQAIENGADVIMGKPLVITELARLLILSIKDRSSRMEKKLEKTLLYASIDSLTHVKNLTAYNEKLTQLSSSIKRKRNHEFGIVFADINRLKYENDVFGHDIGDIYIKNCCKLICDTFIHSPVFRIGGDEFAVILENEDLENADALFANFKEKIEIAKNIPTAQHGKASIAAGLAIYNKNIDKDIQNVVKRADRMMYEDKQRYHNEEKQ